MMFDKLKVLFEENPAAFVLFLKREGILDKHNALAFEHLPLVPPCPFCGYADVILAEDGGNEAYSVHCPECNCYGPSADSEEAALSKWHDRQSPRDK